jgi:small-conductance mechanosensitive channel
VRTSLAFVFVAPISHAHAVCRSEAGRRGTAAVPRAGRFSRWTLTRLLDRASMGEGRRLAIRDLVLYAVPIIGALLVRENAGIDLTAFAVAASALAVVVGFGLQSIISNVISGMIILLERPIEIGNRIELAGVEGIVKEIGARRTTVTPSARSPSSCPTRSSSRTT